MGKVRWGWILDKSNSKRKIICNKNIQHLKGTISHLGRPKHLMYGKKLLSILLKR